MLLQRQERKADIAVRIRVARAHLDRLLEHADRFVRTVVLG